MANDIYKFKPMYSTYWFYIIVIGFILLLTMIGALILTMSYSDKYYEFPNRFGVVSDEHYSWVNINPIFNISIVNLYIFSFTLILIGLLGILFSRNLFIFLIYTELIFFSVSFNFIVVSSYFLIPSGQIYALFITSIAAGESVIGLGLIILTFKILGSIDLNSLNRFRN